MSFNNYYLLPIILVLLFADGSSREIQLSPYAFWDQDGTTVAGWANGMSGSSPSHLSRPLDLSITTDDVLYISDFDNHRIVVLPLKTVADKFIIDPVSDSNSSLFNEPCGLSTTNTSLYVVDRSNHQVRKLSLNGTNATTVSGLSGFNWAFYLYVDDIANIYLSDTSDHRVLLFYPNSTNGIIVAGNGTAGSNNDQLSEPYGVFVNDNGTIYIADTFNHRIMKWFSCASSGIRVAGNGTLGYSSTQLNYPAHILVDTNEYMYISDNENHRIIRWAPNSTFGVCIAACTGTTGTASNQLFRPHSLAFDNGRSLYVGDHQNNRVLKFQILYRFVSYNQPQIAVNTRWYPYGTTFADQNTIGQTILSIFIDYNNTVYVAYHNKSEILIWTEGNIIPAQIHTPPLFLYTSLFVTVNDDIYFENGNEKGRIDKWPKGSNQSLFVTKFLHNCFGLFIDLNNVLYCSMRDGYRVDKVSLNSGSNTPSLVAGTGFSGSGANQLADPFGIFVDIDFNLYVADSGNNRILIFRPGQTIGVVVAGNGTPTNLFLKYPTDVILDADKFLYIVDNNNNRIIRSKDDQFHCIIGCTNQTGSGLDQLSKPYAIRFDSYGNLYVTDELNNRIQKFTLTFNSSDCIDSNFTGPFCNISNTPCAVLQPCQNNGICVNANDNVGYYCSCASGFDGTECQDDHRPCKPNTCWNNGTCREISATEFNCTCAPGWEGPHCEIETIESSSIQTSNSIQSCSVSIIELIPSTVSSSTPWKFRRNENLYITSNIEVSCAQSVSITTKWTIVNYLNGNELNQSVETLQQNLFIPARILSDGLYKMELTATITDYPWVNSSSSVYIEISQSTIDINLIALDTSTMKHDYRADLLLDPGLFSFDMNEVMYNPADWFYSYYCRIYRANSSQSFKLFEDRYQKCFGNKSVPWKYDNVMNSSVTIFGESLQINQNYQLLVQMIHRDDSTRRSIGYLIVEIENIRSPIIIINCLISTMCLSNGQFHYVNPTTQFALFSLCFGDCSSVEKIQWNLYQGSINSSNQTPQWTLFSPISSSTFYGLDTKNLTVLKEFFAQTKNIVYWRFEVVYSFGLENSTDRFDIEINQPPENRRCSIDPPNGTTLTLFTINCSNWFDKDQIKDWTLYGRTGNGSSRMMLGHTIQSTIQLRLPSSADSMSTFHLNVSIRDTFDSITVFSLPSVTILPDYLAISDFIDALQKANIDFNNDTIGRLLSSDEKNTVGQLVTSISELFNEISDQKLKLAARNGLDSTRVSITSLNNELFDQEINSSNKSVLIQLNEEINKQAIVREYLMEFIQNMSINTVDDVIFQSSILSTLTQTTNQLTRKTSSLASIKCSQPADALKSMARRVSYEDVYFTAMYLAECATNVFNGVNGVLQGRGNILQMDLIRAKEALDECDRSFQCPWNDQIEGENEQSILEYANSYYQKQTFNEIALKSNAILSSLTSALNVHLNLHQTVQMKSNSIYFSLEKLAKTFLSNRLNSSDIYFPSSLDQINDTILVRRIIQPLASSDRSASVTNLSRSWSLSILDENEKEIKIQTNVTNRIAFFIPRDPNLFISAMFLQNITEKNETNLYFNYHLVHLSSKNPNLTFSLHLEVHPMDENISYFIIYQFDDQRKFRSIDNWTLFCPPDLNDEGNYVHFLDNDQAANHHSIIYGIRQMNETERNKFCGNKTFQRPTFTEPFQFTSNYKLRVYQSACFYLDDNNQWQSNGLVVGSLTKHNETQCFSTHLTTFSSAILFSSAPMNLNDENNGRICLTTALANAINSSKDSFCRRSIKQIV